MEKNKTGKYLKYAIGEIILVVIGILIALSINNWNENRKNKSIWNNYTESLIKDLKQDTITLNTITNFIESDNAVQIRLAERLSSHNATIDTLKKIARNELVLGFKTYRPPNNKTFLAMQANGTIDFFDEETYSYLLDLQTTQDIVESIVNANNSVFLTQMTNFMSKYPLNEINSIKGPLLDKAWENADADDLFSTVESYMSAKKLMNTYTGERYNELLILTEKVLDRLITIQESQQK